MDTTQVQPTYVGYYLIDSHHRVDEYIERTQQGSKRLFFPVYLRGREWRWYKSGGQRLCFYTEAGARNHIMRSTQGTPRLRNDGSGELEITEKQIKSMRTDSWTQSQL